MSLFQNLTNDGLEENEDRLGGFARPESDVYLATVKCAYAGASPKGAKSVTLMLTMPDNSEYRETVYVTNKAGQNFFLNKDDKTKKVALPGFTTIDDICQVCTDKVLADQESEDKVVNIWDPEAKRELPKSVPVLTELTGKKVLVAIEKSVVNKTEKQGDEYIPTADTREENTIVKVFHPTLRVTVVEAKAGKEAAFIDSWIERNKGKTRDKRQVKDGSMAQAQARRTAQAGPPTSGAPQATGRKSLFGGNATA